MAYVKLLPIGLRGLMSEPRYLSGDEYAHTGVELDIVKCKECGSEYDYAEYHSYTCSDCEDEIIKREKASK
jgi:predicted RNA-binding Zn-ribbon protein involved in translation (DUF1610 family)